MTVVARGQLDPGVTATVALCPPCPWTLQEETPKLEGTEQEPSAPEAEDDGRRHGFLILSREDSTMVKGGVWIWGLGSPREGHDSLRYPQILQTGQEIMELDTSGFATQGPTVFAGNIGDNRYIVQVSPLGIRLLEGGGWASVGKWVPGSVCWPPGADCPVPTVNQLHFIPVDLGAPIVQCAVADPYVVIMSAEGHVTMFLLKSDSYGGRHHRLALHKPPLHHVGLTLCACCPCLWSPAPTAPPAAGPCLSLQQSKVIALCLYRDVSGMFTTESRLSGARDEMGGRSGSEAEGLGSETRCAGGQGAGDLGPHGRLRHVCGLQPYSG